MDNDNKNKFELFSYEELNVLFLSLEKCNNCFLTDRYIQLIYQLEDELDDEFKRRKKKNIHKFRY